MKYLNPVLEHESKRLVLATRLIAAVRRSNLRRAGNLKGQGELITRAIDVLMSGI
ncbi:CcdB family protein [Roseibium sp. MB-4]